MVYYVGAGPWGPGKGGPLSAPEFDNNNYSFDTRITSLETNPPQPNDIVAITLTGSFLSMTQRDGTIIGPVPFTPPSAKWRGDWVADTAYVALDFITVPDDGLYGVLQDHTSADTFDPDATDDDSNLLYKKLMAFIGSGAVFDDLSDVVITSPDGFDIASYDSGAAMWVNRTLLSILDSQIGATQGTIAYRDGSTWAGLAPGTFGQVLTSGGSGFNPTWSASPEFFTVAVTDETTALTTGTAKVTFRMPFAMTLTEVRASLSTASSSGNPAINVKEGGTSIFSTTLTIDATEKTSKTAATPAVISDASLADDAEMTIDINTAGTGAAGLKVTFIGTRT